MKAYLVSLIHWGCTGHDTAALLAGYKLDDLALTVGAHTSDSGSVLP